MTAAELHAIVGSTPRPWWPHRVGELVFVWCDKHGHFAWTDIALGLECRREEDPETLFVGAMVRWLAEQDLHPQIDSHDGTWTVSTLDDIDDDHTGPTLLHALHAACLAAGEEEK